MEGGLTEWEIKREKKVSQFAIAYSKSRFGLLDKARQSVIQIL